MFWIFGYGSLIYSPEAPEAVQERRLVSLVGFRRTFNKRSSSRLTPAAEAFAPFEEPIAGTYDPETERYATLVLGLEESNAHTVVGVALGYPDSERERVVALTDRREGYHPHRESRLNGYIRAEREVVCAASGQVFTSIVYLSNLDPENRWLIPPNTSMDARARALINATPRAGDDPAVQARGLGLFYLDSTRRTLRGSGIIDPDLEELADAIRAVPGPWVSWLV